MRLQKHCSNVKIVFNYLNGIIYSSDFIEYKNREEMLIREAQLDQYNKKNRRNVVSQKSCNILISKVNIEDLGGVWRFKKCISSNSFYEKY